jgi:uncharacterized protein YggE
MTEEQVPKNSKFNALKKINYTYVCIALVAVLVLVVIFCRPWIRPIAANSRTVQVTGTASVKSTPDQFVFYPSYTSKNTDTQAALAELSKKSDEIVAKLKTLGVTEDNIKTNSSSVNGKYMITAMYPDPNGGSNTLQITVTVSNKDLAQKVQDYLLTTSPVAAVSPTPSFSTAKQKKLESQARDEAAKDAKAQAQQMAKNLGFKLGPVKTVENAVPGFSGGGRIMPMTLNASSAPEAGASTVTGSGDMMTTTQAVPASGAVAISADGVTTAGGAGAVKVSQLAVMPGQDEVVYSINVTYFVI